MNIDEAVKLRVEQAVAAATEPQGKVIGFATKIRESYNIDVGYIAGFSYSKHENYYNYWLRSPSWVNDKRFNAVYMDKETVPVDSIAELGIRPGFYLNESTAKIKSGNGTKDDPYILDGTPREGITVFINGEQLDFEQQPLIENNHTLVGMRAVFESLGADVAWNEEDNIVTAVKNDTIIQLQIDNNKMQVNNYTVELETPAGLVNDNTMVPVRAVSEALHERVEWVDDLQRVVVDEQLE